MSCKLQVKVKRLVTAPKLPNDHRVGVFGAKRRDDGFGKAVSFKQQAAS
ncbi:hypothetical protein QWZ13_17420 [Reinekea marina]|nr:hypothetical protein [Reinekea marina]MDN3650689.1 hypothetical protein [Reinekea marina]